MQPCGEQLKIVPVNIREGYSFIIIIYHDLPLESQIILMENLWASNMFDLINRTCQQKMMLWKNTQIFKYYFERVLSHLLYLEDIILIISPCVVRLHGPRSSLGTSTQANSDLYGVFSISARYLNAVTLSNGRWTDAYCKQQIKITTTLVYGCTIV